MKAHYSSENTSINQKMQGHMQMYDSDTQEKKKKKKHNSFEWGSSLKMLMACGYE